jgi:ribosomal protection tetracycline resistance protein
MERTLNLGILAHVDAGKTSLTEQILYRAGAIAAPGSVDKGTAQTDTLALERQRGISIKSAVTAFRIDDLTITLIDTPGHSDFIAEVERAIGVLDAVILVVSAVEGVQPQTRRLSRAIASLGLPCLIFVNKIDRVGARTGPLLAEIERELRREVVPLTEVAALGTRAATVELRGLHDPSAVEDIVDVLSRHDDALLERLVDAPGDVGAPELLASLRRLVACQRLTPVLHGSAMTGAGVDPLLKMVAQLVPARVPAGDAPLAAETFKVQRLPTGERVVLCRVWSGTLENRATVPIVRPRAAASDGIEPAKVTGIDRFRDGRAEPARCAAAGEIVRVHGLPDARIGDWLGEVVRDRVAAFEPPVFESRIAVARHEDQVRLNDALAELTDQDPLVTVRRDPASGETFVRLYGEVQREVIGATLADDYGVAVSFGEAAVLCVERLAGEGRAAEIFPDTDPPFYATVGFRLAPKGGDRSTWTFTPGKAKQGFFDAAEEGGRSVLEQGLHGWPVIDWDVEVTDLIYLVSSVAADYRRLAMLVMADAIRDAGTIVCEPVHDIAVTAPLESVGAVIHAISAHRGTVAETDAAGELATVRGTVPAAEVGAVTRELVGPTNGRADVETRFSDYLPVAGEPPVRRRTDLNPFDRTEFMSRLAGRF